MTLFTKADCQTCHYIKEKFNLAWHELVETAQKELPILVLDDCSTVVGAIPIKKFLRGRGTA
jgi:hypothetical protein